MTTAKQIKSLYAEYKVALAAEHEVFEDLTTKESDLDAAIERTLRAESKFSQALVDFTGGAIDRRDVARMMAFKAEKLESLISRLAA